MATQTDLNIVIKARDEASNTLGSVGGKLDGLMGFASKAATGLLAVGAAAGGLGIAAISAASDMEQQTVAFKTMLGSAEKADTFLREMTAFAAKTPFELKGLQDAAKSLLAYGSSQERVLPQLKSLGDIAAGVGMEKLPQLITAFGQVQAATKLTGGELKQFTEAGVPIIDALAQQFGVSAARIREMTSEGLIGFPEVEKALASLSGEGGKFNNLMENQSTTLGGLISTLKDNWNLFLTQQGAQLIEWAKEFIKWVTSIITDVLPKVTDKLKGFLENMAGAFPTLNQMGTIITGVKDRFVAMATEFEAKTGILAQLRARFSEIWATVQDKLMPALLKLWEASKPLHPLFEAFGKMLAAVVILALKILIELFTALLDWILQIIAKAAELSAAFLEFVKPAIDAVSSAIEWLTKKIEQVIGFFNALRDAAVAAFNAAKSASGFGGGGGGSFGGARAAGGPVMGRSTYLVGERGPELFTPSASGTIIPNHALAGAGGGPTINISIGTVFGGDPSAVSREIGDMIIKRLQLNARVG